MLPEFKTLHTFERSELRCLQNMCGGDNENFLNYVADMVGKMTKARDQAQHDLAMAEHDIRLWENGEME